MRARSLRALAPNPATMQISYTITNTTDRAVVAWGVEIVSIFDQYDHRRRVWSDAIYTMQSAEQDEPSRAGGRGVLGPGASFTFSASLSKVVVPTDQQVLPGTGDVRPNVIVFDDNRAFGADRATLEVQENRQFMYDVLTDHLKVVEDAAKSGGPRAFMKTLLAAPEPPKLPRARLMRRLAEQFNSILERRDPSEAVAREIEWAKRQRAPLEGHTKLIRASE